MPGQQAEVIPKVSELVADYFSIATDTVDDYGNDGQSHGFNARKAVENIFHEKLGNPLTDVETDLVRHLEGQQKRCYKRSNHAVVAADERNDATIQSLILYILQMFRLDRDRVVVLIHPTILQDDGALFVAHLRMFLYQAKANRAEDQMAYELEDEKLRELEKERDRNLLKVAHLQHTGDETQRPVHHGVSMMNLGWLGELTIEEGDLKGSEEEKEGSSSNKPTGKDIKRPKEIETELVPSNKLKGNSLTLTHTSSGDKCKLIFVDGSARDTAALRDANVVSAQSFVKFGSKELNLKDDKKPLNPDAETIVTSMELEKELTGDTFEDVTVICELLRDSNVYFLRQHGSLDEEILEGKDPETMMHESLTQDTCLFEWPLFAAGRVTSQTMMDSLTVRLAGSPEEEYFWRTLFQEAGDLFRRRPIPLEFPTDGIWLGESDTAGPSPPEKGQVVENGADPRQQNRNDDDLLLPHTYRDLFKYCLGRDELLLGLYRPTGAEGSMMNSMCTNPPPDTRLHRFDVMFVMISLNHVPRGIREMTSAGVQGTPRRLTVTPSWQAPTPRPTPTMGFPPRGTPWELPGRPLPQTPPTPPLPGI